jgi:hypothetical protein
VPRVSASLVSFPKVFPLVFISVPSVLFGIHTLRRAHATRIVPKCEGTRYHQPPVALQGASSSPPRSPPPPLRLRRRARVLSKINCQSFCDSWVLVFCFGRCGVVVSSLVVWLRMGRRGAVLGNPMSCGLRFAPELPDLRLPTPTFPLKTNRSKERRAVVKSDKTFPSSKSLCTCVNVTWRKTPRRPSATCCPRSCPRPTAEAASRWWGAVQVESSTPTA